MRFSLTVLALALISATAVSAQPGASTAHGGLGGLKSKINPDIQNNMAAVAGTQQKRAYSSSGDYSTHQKRHEPDTSRAHDEDDPDDGDEGDEGDNDDEGHHGRDP